MKAIHNLTVLMVAVGIGLLLASGGGAGIAPSAEPQTASELTSPPAACASDEVDFAQNGSQVRPEQVNGNPCKSCPKSLAPGCTRVSCDPCCFQCPGEPFLRCL